MAGKRSACPPEIWHLLLVALMFAFLSPFTVVCFFTSNYIVFTPRYAEGGELVSRTVLPRARNIMPLRPSSFFWLEAKQWAGNNVLLLQTPLNCDYRCYSSPRILFCLCDLCCLACGERELLCLVCPWGGCGMHSLLVEPFWCAPVFQEEGQAGHAGKQR